jgi:shikimate dehydrogenase
VPDLLTMGQARAAAGPEVSLVGVIGSPILHSLSPLLHNAAFVALGLGDRWRSLAFEIPAGRAPLADALDDMRVHGFTGLSVTMPHKADASALVDVPSEGAARLAAVNCVHNRDGVLHGTNTDGEGFVAALARGAGFSAADRRCLVVGAGGAARAVVLALADAGAAEVAVVNRTASRALAAAELAGAVGRVAELPEADGPGHEATVAQAHLVVNATPIGMAGGGGSMDGAGGRVVGGGSLEWPIAPELLHAGQVVADLVYVPRPTPWLVAASALGALTVDGLGMLVHQAAAQLALWTGLEPPVDAMWRAVAGPSSGGG